MLDFAKKKPQLNRKTIFAIGVVVGVGVTVIVFKDWMVFDRRTINLVGPDALTRYLAENGETVDFVTKFGTFVLLPPTK